MKKFTVLLINTILLVTLLNGQPNWHNGKYITPKEDLHVLVVFVSSDDYRMSDDAGCYINNNNMIDTPSELACVSYYYNGTLPTAPAVTTPFSQAAIIPSWAAGEGFINSEKSFIRHKVDK